MHFCALIDCAIAISVTSCSNTSFRIDSVAPAVNCGQHVVILYTVLAIKPDVHIHKTPLLHTTSYPVQFLLSSTMDSDTEPLIKVDASEAENASRSSPQHFCARCSSELESHQDHKESKPWTPRHILIIGNARVLVVVLRLKFVQWRWSFQP